jgi:hypothetical protein
MSTNPEPVLIEYNVKLASNNKEPDDSRNNREMTCWIKYPDEEAGKLLVQYYIENSDENWLVKSIGMPILIYEDVLNQCEHELEKKCMWFAMDCGYCFCDHEIIRNEKRYLSDTIVWKWA